MTEEVRTRLTGVCLVVYEELLASAKVTPQRAAAVRVQVIYNSFRGRVGGRGGWVMQMLPAWRPRQLEPLG